MLFTLLSLLESPEQRKTRSTCLQCGQCCTSFGGHLAASPRDLTRWRACGREDLLAATNRLGWIWVDPETKQLISPCPHIERLGPDHARCRIYEVRPDICRSYPTLAHGKRCLRGVFLGCWSTLCCGALPEWLTALEALPLAA